MRSATGSRRSPDIAGTIGGGDRPGIGAARARGMLGRSPPRQEEPHDVRPLRALAALAPAVALALAGCARPAPAPPSAENGWFESGQAAVARARATAPPGTRARNVILFIGDGMGISTVTAARILEGQLRGQPGEENMLAFEELPHLALAKTYSVNMQVSDSAATATAMSSGVKTKAYVHGHDESATSSD